jgi:hypothetical protein
MPPIATELMRRNEMPLCARSGCEQSQQTNAIRSPRRQGRAAAMARRGRGFRGFEVDPFGGQLHVVINWLLQASVAQFDQTGFYQLITQL